MSEGSTITDAQVARAVAVYDEARCRVNEQWHGGFCEPMSEVHRKNIEPMMRPVLEDFVAECSSDLEQFQDALEHFGHVYKFSTDDEVLQAKDAVLRLHLAAIAKIEGKE